MLCVHKYTKLNYPPASTHSAVVAPGYTSGDFGFFGPLFFRILSEGEFLLLKKLEPSAGFSLSRFLQSPMYVQQECFTQHHSLGLHAGLANFCDLSEKVVGGQLLLEGHGNNLRKYHNSDRSAQRTVKACLSVASYPG